MGTSVSPFSKGDGVAKDAAHAVFLLRKAAEQDDQMQADAQTRLAECYATGEGVEADTAQAAVWCQKAAKSGFEPAIDFLPIIRRCDFCGATPARQLCKRCRKTRYCGAACIQGHWTRPTDPHKGHCRRRAAEASCAEAGGTLTSTSEGSRRLLSYSRVARELPRAVRVVGRDCAYDSVGGDQRLRRDGRRRSGAGGGDTS
jgi:TPR repeat protein